MEKSLFPSSQVKSSQIYLYSTFNVQNNSKCFTEIKALQQGAEKALKICKIIERNNSNELKSIKTSNSLDKSVLVWRGIAPNQQLLRPRDVVQAV